MNKQPSQKVIPCACINFKTYHMPKDYPDYEKYIDKFIHICEDCGKKFVIVQR